MICTFLGANVNPPPPPPGQRNGHETFDVKYVNLGAMIYYYYYYYNDHNYYFSLFILIIFFWVGWAKSLLGAGGKLAGSLPKYITELIINLNNSSR